MGPFYGQLAHRAFGNALRQDQAQLIFSFMNRLELALEGSIQSNHDGEGNTMAHRAIHRGDFLLLQALMDGEPFVANLRQETPLHWACRRGCPMMVELLLQNSDVGAIDENGHTPLQWALTHHQSKVVPLLLRSLSDQALQLAVELTKQSEYPWSDEEIRSHPCVPLPNSIPKRSRLSRCRDWFRSS